jgi:hypothetical protein
MNLNPTLVHAFLRRFFGLLVVSLLIVLLMSEGFYRLIRTDSERAPQTFEITIPAGTAERIAAGEPGPEIPNTVFVVGDTLTVHNLDSTSHELGPVWLPPGTSGSLSLGEANDFVFNCSFQSTKFLGLTVRDATTWSSRLSALWYGTPPVWMFLFVYSFVLFPLKREDDEDAAAPGDETAVEGSVAT